MFPLINLLDKYEGERAPRRNSTPLKFAAWYKNLSVLVDERRTTKVRVQKYRMNTSDPNSLDEAGRIRDTDADNEYRLTRDSLRSYTERLRTSDNREDSANLERLKTLSFVTANGTPGARFKRVYLGKGNPWDISFVLGLLKLTGRLTALLPSLAVGDALQAYCDRYIGVDCSGFVNSYFTVKGRRDDVLNDRPTISMYAARHRRLAVMPGAPGDHVLCWVRGESRTSVAPGRRIGFSHIMLIDEWVVPPSSVSNAVGARFRNTQSSASLGGITTGVYEILGSPAAHFIRPLWRIQRVPGQGDNVLEPHTLVWNEVFLAPPL